MVADAWCRDAMLPRLSWTTFAAGAAAGRTPWRTCAASAVSMTSRSKRKRMVLARTAASCLSVAAGRVVAAQIKGMDPACRADQEHLQRYDKLLAMRERESRAINTLARGMRLTQQSRYDAAKADRAAKSATGPSKPWEFAVGE